MSYEMPERNENLEKSLHPELLPRLGDLLEVLEMAVELRPEPDALIGYIKDNESWASAWEWAMEVVTSNRCCCLGGTAYAVPFLHPSVCEKLVKRAADLGEDHEWKADGLDAPALVLGEVDPRLQQVLASLAKYLDVWHLILYRAAPQSISSVRFVQHVEGDSQAPWQHTGSDYTAIVSLNPGEIEGGGTELMLTPTDAQGIQPLPPGFALLFNGRQLLRREVQVTQGERYLLEFMLDSHPVA